MSKQAERLRAIERRLQLAIPRGAPELSLWLRGWHEFNQHALHDISWLIREMKILVVENESLRAATAVQLGQKAGTQDLAETSYDKILAPQQRRTNTTRPPPAPLNREESSQLARDRGISQIVLDLVDQIAESLPPMDRATFSRELQIRSDPITGDLPELPEILIGDDDIVDDEPD